MHIGITTELKKETDAVIIGLFEEEEEYYESLGLSQELSEAIENNLFSKKYGKTYSTKLDNTHRKVLVISLGSKKDFTLEKLRRTISKAVKFTKNNNFISFSTNITELAKELFNDEKIGRTFAEAVGLSNYKFKKYINPEEPEKDIEEISIQWSIDPNQFLEGLKTGRVIANATNFARDLVNEPSQLVTPTYLESVSKEIDNISVEVLNKEDMERKGMGALLGVSIGSDQPPKLIFLKYNGAGEEPYTAIIGKGITFDTGGYNLKPSGYMETMKCDMSGAASVLGTIKAVSELGLRKNIIGVIPACENAISGSATKPSDILTAYNKKTIEVTNTDAEGRLILADALCYTEEKYNPEIMIDIATLTGACEVALGSQIAAILSKDEDLIKEINKAGQESYDQVWRLPLLEEYEDSMKGSITDLKNTSPKGYGAGTITATVFLSHFVKEVRWAHIDIAGTAFINEEKEYLTKGATGSGVRLLTYYFLNAEQQQPNQ